MWHTQYAIGRTIAIYTMVGVIYFGFPNLLHALEEPVGEIILEIDGYISESNDETGRAVFDRSMLEAMGLVEVLTETPWTDGLIRFEGVLMRDLMNAVGAGGDSVRATAINDYAVEIPMGDFEDHSTILAVKKDGAYMRIRDKGPLWLIYPWTDNPDLQTEVYHSRSIWQLKSLTVQ